MIFFFREYWLIVKEITKAYWLFVQRCGYGWKNKNSSVLFWNAGMKEICHILSSLAIENLRKTKKNEKQSGEINIKISLDPEN